MDDFFKKMLEDIEKNPPEDKNGGYKALMKDLLDLVIEAQDFEFDDFRNKKYPAPKIELASRLHELRENTINGKYDN